MLRVIISDSAGVVPYFPSSYSTWLLWPPHPGRPRSRATGIRARARELLLLYEFARVEISFVRLWLFSAPFPGALSEETATGIECRP